MVTNRFYFRILNGLLALLGFATAFSCSPSVEYGSPPDEVLYGPPVEQYRDSTEQESPSEVKQLLNEENLNE